VRWRGGASVQEGNGWSGEQSKREVAFQEAGALRNKEGKGGMHEKVGREHAIQNK